jgi:hypothetical protein
MAGRRPELCNAWCIYDKHQGGACLYCGWTKEQRTKREKMAEQPRIYDIEKDEYRDATQADIEMLSAVAKSYGNIRKFVDQEHARLQEELKQIRSRAGLPHE